jgi:hypothetical protein
MFCGHHHFFIVHFLVVNRLFLTIDLDKCIGFPIHQLVTMGVLVVDGHQLLLGVHLGLLKVDLGDSEGGASFPSLVDCRGVVFLGQINVKNPDLSLQPLALLLMSACVGNATKRRDLGMKRTDTVRALVNPVPSNVDIAGLDEAKVRAQEKLLSQWKTNWKQKEPDIAAIRKRQQAIFDRLQNGP